MIGKRKKYPKEQRDIPEKATFSNRITTAYGLSKSSNTIRMEILKFSEKTGVVSIRLGIFFVTVGTPFLLGLNTQKGGDAAFGKETS